MRINQNFKKALFGAIFMAFILIFTLNVRAVCTLGSNLILNGDAETDTALAGSGSDHDLTNWDPETGGFTVVRYTTGGGFPTNSDPGPAVRGNFFFAGGPQNGVTSSGTQIIDVTDCAGYIDSNRQTYDVSGFFGGFASQPDTASLTLTFKDEFFEWGTVTIGPVTASDRGNATGMLSRSASGIIPSGTRFIEVVLSMPPTSGYNDGYADNLSLKFGIANGTWDGGGATNNWSEVANWTNNVLPTNNMSVVFDGTSTKDVVFDIPLTRTGGTIIDTGYTGTLSTGSTNLTFGFFGQAGGTVTAGSGNIIFNDIFNKTGGTFNGGGGTLTFNGSFWHSGGTFNGGNGNLVVNSELMLGNGTFNAPSGNLIYNGVVPFDIGPFAVFNPNGGTFVLNSSGIAPHSFITSLNFHNLTISSGFFMQIPFVVGGNLNLLNGTLTGNGTFPVSGNITIGSGYSGGTPAIQFVGTGNQTYTNNGGVNPSGIWTINKPSGTVNLASNLDLSNGTGNLVLTNGTITTGANTVIAGTRNIARTNGFINGNLRRTYTATGSKTFDVGTINGYAPVTINATAGTFGASTTFTVGGNNGTLGGSSPTQSLTRNWSLEPSAGGITSADIRFDYLQTDVPSGANEASFSFLRNNGTNTTALTPTSIDTTANFATLNGVTSFSNWTLGNLAPLASTATISGRVVSDSGRGISKARLTLTDSNGNSRIVMTNPFGYYRFDEVEAGRNYVISVFHKRYEFPNPSQVVFVNENLTNIDFTALNQASNNSKIEISGRVKDAKGSGMANISIELTGGSFKRKLIAKTDSEGFYSFDNLTIGETYILSVASKRYSFANPMRVIVLNDELTDEDFIAEG